MLTRINRAVASKIEALIDRSIRRSLQQALDADTLNIARHMQRRALEETAVFVEQHMTCTPFYDDKFELLEAAIQVAPKTGLVCEFGVAGGETVNFIASKVDDITYGFDSFEGLPEDWVGGLKKKAFKQEALPRIRANVRLVKGLFQEALPPFVKEHTGPCAFVHIDCDLFSSTETVFRHLGAQIIPGTVIVFDEFFNYPGWKQGEHQAFTDFIAASRGAFE